MRWRPFPKRDGRVDKDRVKELYLSGPHFEWDEFCALHKFNPGLRAEFPLRSWENLWLERKTIEQAQMLAPKALALRGKIARGRVDVIVAQMETNALLREVLNQNLRRVAQSQSAAMVPVVAQELAVFAKVNQLVQDAEFRSLLMSAKTKAVNDLMEGLPRGDEPAKRQEESLCEIEINTMGAGGMSSQETIALIASYFDQFEAKSDSNLEKQALPGEPIQTE